MPIITSQIAAVAPRTVTSKKNGQQYTFYDLQTADNQKFDVSRDLATEAYRLIGQPVQINYEVVQNGTFVNNKVLDLQPYGDAGFHGAPVNTGLPAAVAPSWTPGIIAPVTTATPPGNALYAPQAPPQPIQSVLPDLPQGPTEKDEQIWRQVAAKVSAHLSESKDEFWGNIDHLMHYFRTGQKPDMSGQSPQIAPSAAAPSHVDDDIPFMPTI